MSFGDKLLFSRLLEDTSTLGTTDPIFVGELSGQTGTLLFALNSIGTSGSAMVLTDAPNASVLLDNISFSAVPEPTAVYALLVGATLLVRRLRDREIQ